MSGSVNSVKTSGQYAAQKVKYGGAIDVKWSQLPGLASGARIVSSQAPRIMKPKRTSVFTIVLKVWRNSLGPLIRWLLPPSFQISQHGS